MRSPTLLDLTTDPGAPSIAASSRWVGYRAKRDRTVFLAAILTGLCLAPTLQAQTPDTLRATFLTPPDAARPMVRWWWFGPAVVKPEILKELQQMKADGIGGAELAFVYPEVLDDPAKDLKNLPFLSPAMLDAVNYAQTEGRKLGLRIDVTLCSGWPYGGPATTLDEAVTRIVTREVAIPAGSTTVAAPTMAAGDTLIAASIVTGTPTPAPVRGRGPAAAPPAPTWNPASAQPYTSGATLTASDTPRVALFFVQSHTKQQVKRAAVAAEGYVLDPFSKQAVATHLKAVGEPLLSAFAGNPPYAIFSDSLEAYGADWTPALPAEFKRRRGYDLVPHLPELVAGGSPAAEQVRHDYGVTLTELVNENYLTQINDWATAHKTKFRSQTYGEPAVSFSSQNLVGLAEGEGPQWRAWSTLRWATSANHVFGHNVTSGETFTWLHSPVFRATPLDMKTEADIDFIMGENQLIFHGWPYSAPDGEVPEPGWSLYAAASFNNHNPWHSVMPAVDGYIARISALLRQGQPANQVAILLPTDDVWATFSPGHTTVTGAMQTRITPLMGPILSAGYNIDYIDAEAIDKVGLGSHQILVLPPTDRIPAATATKIAAWAAGGGKVIAVGKVPTLKPDGKPLGVSTAEMALVPDADGVAMVLPKAAAPDFKLVNGAPEKDQLGFIRRKLPNADIYFVANTSPQPIKTAVWSFGTTFSHGEAFDPDNGTITSASSGCQSLVLAPYESRVFLFTPATQGEKAQSANAPKGNGGSIEGECYTEGPLTAGGIKPAPASSTNSPMVDLSGNWTVTFTGSPHVPQPEATLTDWTANPTTLHFSGEAVYSRDFTLPASPGGSVYLAVDGGKALPGAPNSPPEHGAAPVLGPDGLPNPAITRTGPGMHAYYEPPVREAALVLINGQSAGALWHPPYRLDVSKLLKPGQNHIEIHVFNTALNAWSALPPHDYAPLIAKYGDRFQMQDLNQVQPVSSGILGTIKLVTAP